MLTESADIAVPRASRSEALLRRLPAPALVFAFAIGGVMLAISIAKKFQDPDFFWHFTTGQLIATTGSVPSTDPFSFTWFGQPWTLHEWLSEVIIYFAVDRLGLIGTLIAFGLLPGAIFAVLIWMLTSRGVRLQATGLSVALGAWLLVPYVTPRPQAFSWLLMAVLVWLLWSLTSARPRRILWVIPLFVLWANLHGLYAVGLGALGVYVLFTLGGRTPMKDAKRWALAGLVGAGLGSALTPAGPIGLLYPLRYIGIGGGAGDWGLENIAEWQSPNFHDPLNLGVLALVVVLMLLGRKGVPGWMATLGYIGVVMSLLAVRNVPLAAVWCVPVMAIALDAQLPARRRHAYAASVAVVRRGMEIVLAVVVAGAAIFIVTPRSLATEITTNLAERFPVAALDRLAAEEPDARVLAEYGWGGYVIYRLYDTGGRVFVDGRNDMYSEQILADYSAIRSADPGWSALADRYHIEAMVLPPDATVTRGPARDAGWCETYRDSVQVLLLRHCPS